ncbi:UNVERIFIED_CONTAM: hypothetical protein PYX00_010593 [Menopon gallinae]|uniref:G-protein coupled receptors family 1 profile domain-containing protein n=1 Tax=Menopon gallinae TaxID=328185 RepID=A0AAW2HGC3_9NEOP
MLFNVTEAEEFSDFANDSAGGNATGPPETTSQFSVTHKSQESAFESDIIIPLYVVIFVLSVVGNSLVLATLGQNKRMRTITNVYLLNLVF